MNRAKNFDDYKAALPYFTCPSQNWLFAVKRGDIAIWQQGRIPAMWERQGVFVMPGTDSSYMWQGYIPMEENPHVINPASGFVSSANQRPADSSLSILYRREYDLYRGYTINQLFKSLQALLRGYDEPAQ